MDFAPGDRVDRYALVQPLGEGGQGSVWRAEDPLAPGQPRAIKLVPLVLARPNDVERVRREARALAKLEHPSLVRCHALFEDLKHSALGVVMDFVDGTSLRAAADEPWMTDQHRFAALRHIAHALAYVHREGVVHRDLKLDNVLVRRAFWDDPEKAENIKLVDFGIAKVSDGSHALTAVDTIVGTIAYLSPELLDPSFFQSNGATAAADVFAFGVLAWKLLVGGHPTGLPAGAGIVAYGAAYRAVAGSSQPWPANAPPGAWGQLLENCLRVRASERIADGAALAARCDQAGDFTTSRRPELAAEPADPLAPTAEIGPPRAEAAPPPSADRVARAHAVTEHQAIVARPPKREDITNDAVVKPLESAAPRAATQLSAPLAAPARESSSKAAPIAVGAIMLALAGSAAAFALWKPAPDPSPPLVPTATQAPTRSAEPRATPPIVAPEAAAEDAPNEAMTESPTRPVGCSADQPVCECCASGRDCAPGRCDEVLNPDENWIVRLGSASMDGTDVGKSPDVELCARIVRAGDRTKCTRLGSPDADPSKLFYVTYGDVQGYGVEFELRSGTDAGTRALRAKLKGKLTRLALCQGIEIDQFTAVEPGSGGTGKILIFLDDQTAPPEKCAPREPGRSQ